MAVRIDVAYISVMAQCNVVGVYLSTRLHGFITQKTSIMKDPLWKLLQYIEHSNAISFLQPESKQSQLTLGRNILSCIRH